MIAWFLHIVSKDVLNFENLIHDESIKIQNGRQKIQNGWHRA